MIIAPSLLAADPCHFGAETLRATRAGADWLHLDIMDGHFVPNVSFGPEVVRRLRPLTKIPFDVHLMCSRPEILLEPFKKAGADTVTVHVELGDQVEGLIWKIRSLGMKVGLAVNPPTQVGAALPFLKKIDLLLIMTVNPGFGGQPFIAEMLPKIRQAHDWRKGKGLNYRLEVDGGVTQDTALQCAAMGADTLVAGTSLFGKRQMRSAVTRMRQGAEKAARTA